MRDFRFSPLTLLSLRIPRCDDDDDDIDDEFNGNVLYCVCCGRICKLREAARLDIFLAAELSREPCCEPLREPGPSGINFTKNVIRLECEFHKFQKFALVIN